MSACSKSCISIASKVSILFIVFLGALWFLRPLALQYLISYTKITLEIAYKDYERQQNVEYLQVETEWRLHEYEMQFFQTRCNSSKASVNKRYAWLTAMTNDDFVIGAVATAFLISKLSCHKQMIALVSKGVSASGLSALKKAGYDVRVVEPLDCNWMDRKKNRKERNSGIVGTHMRFVAWNFTNYDKIIYFDADVVPLTNADELFEMETDFAAAYCGRPGLVDPCFNAGLIVFHPSKEDHSLIMKMWSDLSDSHCPNDQVLLWHFYADNGRWTPLPYAYNVRRAIYHPMKFYHFACCLTPKPWRVRLPPTKLEVADLKGPIFQPKQMVLLWWKYFYVALEHYKLAEWWNNAQETIHVDRDH